MDIVNATAQAGAIQKLKQTKFEQVQFVVWSLFCFELTLLFIGLSGSPMLLKLKVPTHDLALKFWFAYYFSIGSNNLLHKHF